MKFIIINGPNLNLVGEREPDVYGSDSLDNYLNDLKQDHKEWNIELFQSNIEGELISKIQSSSALDGMIINAGGYSHTSVGIRDAVKAAGIPTINVHISNPSQREDFRELDLLTDVCTGYIGGLGIKGYEMACEVLEDQVKPSS